MYCEACHGLYIYDEFLIFVSDLNIEQSWMPPENFLKGRKIIISSRLKGYTVSTRDNELREIASCGKGIFKKDRIMRFAKA